ncbi:hypothetical protein AC249_AIPGENE4868 [Exaiptasia diaphana]|nr:hypothetical protein AC249_AIPGENE4868 [Exaiptasia diaphana]
MYDANEGLMGLTVSRETAEKLAAKKRVWLEQRFSANEVINRAKYRLRTEETGQYNILYNNCESLIVNWCKCGLNVSFQASPWHEHGWEAAKAAELVGAIVMSPLGPISYVSGGVLGAFVGHCLEEVREEAKTRRRN